MSHIRGRFQKAADEKVARYTSSLPFDWRLYRHDIAGSIAHVKMLARQDIINKTDSVVIVQGLESIEREIAQGEFKGCPGNPQAARPHGHTH